MEWGFTLKRVHDMTKTYSQSLLMDKVIKNKGGLELVPSRSSVHETSSEKCLYSLYIIQQSLMM